MPLGPGKYDEVATDVRERTKASLLLLAVIGGNKGTGFEVVGDLSQPNTATMLLALPAILRSIADEIEGGRQ